MSSRCDYRARLFSYLQGLIVVSIEFSSGAEGSLLRALKLKLLKPSNLFASVSIRAHDSDINLVFSAIKKQYLKNSSKISENNSRRWKAEEGSEGESSGEMTALHKSNTRPTSKKTTPANRCNAKYKATLNGSGKININFHFS